ncbi:hypothetical protein ACFXI5_36735, partial [Streptomyces niveus]
IFAAVTALTAAMPLRSMHIEVDRKILAELAVNDANAFAALVEVAQKALPSDVNAPKAAA